MKENERLLICRRGGFPRGGNSWPSKQLSSEQRRESVQPENVSSPELMEGRQRESRKGWQFQFDGSAG